ncbi:hypothetical protein JW756_01195 [Candidatus Woesearchaeota archaeon]|nr:hypothetical protein [Candidatus Woesearchaeota archaeon]
MADDKTIDEIRAKYEKELKKSFNETDNKKKTNKAGGAEEAQALTSSEYSDFQKENMPHHLNLYEQACNWAEKILKVEPDKKKIPELEEAIKICHLDITPTGVMSFSLLAPIILALAIIFLTYITPSLLMPGSGSTFFVLFAIMSALAIIIPLQKLPYFLANNWRMKASNQMVLAVFYIVTYMRHTSNLERALSFASEHLTPPLALDIKKILWNVESEKFDSLKESLDDYLQTWRKYNMEFIESMHLIESSLFETSEGRRLDALDKSLSVILDETYEKMLHYAHNLKSPLTALHMMGIILPILGLVILPLMVSFMPEVKWYHLFVLYNLVLPIMVFYLARNILSTRPTGYGESDISETNPELKKYRDIIIPIGKSELRISPMIISAFILVIFLIIGFTPLILHAANPNFDVVTTSEGVKVIEKPTDPDATFYFLGYREEILNGEKTGRVVGPFGLGATLLSFFIILAFGIGIGMYFHLRSKNVIKIREQAKALEQEFASALFQLGNRLGDGLPAEIAFGKVAEVMEGTLSGKFFDLVSVNISKLGMSVEQAIFDEKRGALVYYPSNLIESSMKVLVESSKKGPMIASQAVINVAEYIKQIHRVDERLKDLMADIVSSMKSQISFLTPAIAGIVVGITGMITQILGSLSMRLSELSTEAGEANISQAGLLGMFGTGIPTFYFQVIVGLYVVQITYILSVLINGIENGSDKLSERFIIGKNLIKTAITYTLITLAVTILFSVVAGSILSSFTASG